MHVPPILGLPYKGHVIGTITFIIIIITITIIIIIINIIIIISLTFVISSRCPFILSIYLLKKRLS